jgi:hypothetical protein
MQLVRIDLSYFRCLSCIERNCCFHCFKLCGVIQALVEHITSSGIMWIYFNVDSAQCTYTVTLLSVMMGML